MGLLRFQESLAGIESSLFSMMKHSLAKKSTALACGLLLVLILTWPPSAGAYSVLSHEAIIDVAWSSHLRPLLLQRFPEATPDELKVAHGYAYGGAIIADMGYYPHGSPLFSDLTHYVRSGDFVMALLRDSNDVNGYAFALGALAHYAADNNGHRIGTNRAVPILYPKLKKKFGDSVSYEKDPLAHVKTEFGFDVLEVAKERYAPDSYHDFIGFQVDSLLLEQAFQETYGLELKSVLTDEEKVLGSFRYDVSTLIPKATRIAWTLKKDEIMKDQPGVTRSQFLYNLKRASFEKNWGKKYTPPTAGERFLAFLYKILPKIGPLRILQLRTPTPETEKMFEASFNATLNSYRTTLDRLRDGQLELPNDNFDVGEATGPGIYHKNDQAHAQLLDALAKQNFAGTSPEIREELLEFFSHTTTTYFTERKPKEWANLQRELGQLKTAAAPSSEKASLQLPAATP